MIKETISTGVSDSFTFDLLRLEREAHPGCNVVLSPLSISLALGMLMNGSRGKMRRKAASLLGFGVGRSLRGMNESYSRLREALAETREVDLDIAHNLVAGAGLKIKKNFIKKSEQYFDARISLLDLDDPSALVAMNSFICQKTKGKIPSILEGLENADITQLILLNAFFFHGFWKQGFDRLLTQEEKFTQLEGKTASCALMYRHGVFDYVANARFEAVKLPLGQSGRFAMYAFLPKDKGEPALQSLATALSVEGLSHCDKHFAASPGELFLPRFRTGYSSRLNQSLRSLGLADVFDGEIDLPSLVKGNPVQKLILEHKTVVQVNEDEAEVLSGRHEVAAGGSSAFPPEQSFSLRFDRPFYFLVRDELTSTITLAGFINNPSC